MFVQIFSLFLFFTTIFVLLVTKNAQWRKVSVSCEANLSKRRKTAPIHKNALFLCCLSPHTHTRTPSFLFPPKQKRKKQLEREFLNFLIDYFLGVKLGLERQKWSVYVKIIVQSVCWVQFCLQFQSFGPNRAIFTVSCYGKN